MKKLLNFKKYLTLEKASLHLTEIFEEEVSVADILMLALDRHITLSVDFVGSIEVIKGYKIDISEAIKVEVAGILAEFYRGVEHEPFIYMSPRTNSDCDKNIDFMEEYFLVRISENEFIDFERKLLYVDGVWDLAMIGAEKIDVEFLYHQMTGGPRVELMNIDGVFLKMPSNPNEIYNIQERFSEEVIQEMPGGKAKPTNIKDMLREKHSLKYHFPSGQLPENSVFVVRTEELLRFEEKIKNNKPKSQSTKATNSHLRTIYALSEALLYGLTGVKNKDAGAIIQEMSRKGVECPVGEKTLAKYLEEGKP